jgi:hypothetical protein
VTLPARVPRRRPAAAQTRLDSRPARPHPPAPPPRAGRATRVKLGAKVRPQLVVGGLVVYYLDDIEISPVGRAGKPAAMMTNQSLRNLGLIAILDIENSKGKLFWSEGAATRMIQVPLLLGDAEIGDVIALDRGKGETQVKVAAIEAMRSVGVEGKRVTTIGATLRFVLREHAP